VPLSAVVGADEIHWFFEEKLTGGNSSTADVFRYAAQLHVSSISVAVPRRHRLGLTASRLSVLVCPLPTHLLKENVDVLAPFLIELFNRSLERGVVPTTFKAACITPLNKKSDLDPADMKSY